MTTWLHGYLKFLRQHINLPQSQNLKLWALKGQPPGSPGFTLVELLVVTMIILLISTIGIVSYRVANRSARDGKRRGDLEQIRAALEIYRNDCGSYPGSITFGSRLSASCPNLNTYMEVIPQDPKSPGIRYSYTGYTNTYVLCAYLESPPLSNPCSQSCSGACGGQTCNYNVCNP